MIIRLSAPSKTFLTGEYAALMGGPALILNTRPRFELIAKKVGLARDEEIVGISRGAPAWDWLQQRQPLLQGWHLQFQDPHNGLGGFGASSAQFLLAHAFTTALQTGFDEPNFKERDIWNDYRVITKQTGSGADVLAQFAGQVALTDTERVTVDAWEWPYPTLGFVILRTGRKLATHEYLRSLDHEQLASLIPAARAAAETFDVETSEMFLEAFKRFAVALRQHGFQSPLTLEILQPFEAQKWCLAAKGCGAYGADTILIIYPSELRRDVLAFAAAQKVSVVATDSDLTFGLEVHREAN